jgi:hypothetical protein
VYTTSYHHPGIVGSGVTHDTITISYLPGDAPSSFWDPEFKSAVNGSLNLTASLMSGEPCTSGETSGSQGMYDQLDRETMFPFDMPTAPVKLDKVCRNETFCEEYLTCVISGQRIDKELGRQFGEAISTGFLSNAPLAERAEICRSTASLRGRLSRSTGPLRSSWCLGTSGSSTITYIAMCRALRNLCS